MDPIALGSGNMDKRCRVDLAGQPCGLESAHLTRQRPAKTAPYPCPAPTARSIPGSAVGPKDDFVLIVRAAWRVEPPLLECSGRVARAADERGEESAGSQPHFPYPLCFAVRQGARRGGVPVRGWTEASFVLDGMSRV